MSEPTTEAGKRLLDAPDVLLMLAAGDIIGLNEGELELQVAAIEAEARAAVLREVRAEVGRLPEPTLGLKGGVNRQAVLAAIDRRLEATP